MKVKELIAFLQDHNPETMVVVDGYEGGVTELRGVLSVNIALNENDPDSFFGPHEIASQPQSWSGREHVPAIYLPRVAG